MTCISSTNGEKRGQKLDAMYAASNDKSKARIVES
jgi:hypothetical protein